jgi:hypothetical protein
VNGMARLGHILLGALLLPWMIFPDGVTLCLCLASGPAGDGLRSACCSETSEARRRACEEEEGQGGLAFTQAKSCNCCVRIASSSESPNVPHANRSSDALAPVDHSERIDPISIEAFETLALSGWAPPPPSGPGPIGVRLTL